ncbi:2-amino-4-hydroxy-6-hydroxymethyldihydropteridine diphosphokinase [bacterium]|nr:2-amino-4-hydroxy-6-hydroxymethyldihydropteridine diphosphokinase [bacterium]
MLQIKPIALGLGSSQGDRLAFLKAALERLSEDLFLDEPHVSGVFETEPWGGVAQGKFLNAVALGSTDWKPPAILNYLKQVERDLGRKRTVRNADREIDLDILFYDELVWEAEDLHIPHPALADREFVLLPLVQVAAGWKHPHLGKTAQELLAAWQKNHASTARVFPQSL